MCIPGILKSVVLNPIETIKAGSSVLHHQRRCRLDAFSKEQIGWSVRCLDTPEVDYKNQNLQNHAIPYLVLLQDLHHRQMHHLIDCLLDSHQNKNTDMYILRRLGIYLFKNTKRDWKFDVLFSIFFLFSISRIQSPLPSL